MIGSEVLGSVFVPGKPAPQGSTRGFNRGGRVVVTADNKHTKPWRADVQAHLRDHIGDGIMLPDGQVTVTLSFVMPRRASEPKRTTPPHTRKPDLDKLVRAVLDAMTGIVYTDDAQVTGIGAHKSTAGIGEQPGVLIAWRQWKPGSDA